MDTNPITLKLVVDTAANRVAFVESDKEFVDILLSFLTIPLGSVVNLFGKKSSVGSVDNMYCSVEKLDSQFLETEACRTMLLRPRNEATHNCKGLLINLPNKEPAKYYACSLFDRNSLCSHISLVRNTRCPCNREMGKELYLSTTGSSLDDRDGVFVKPARFAITDDLVIAPSCAVSSFLEKLNIRDWNSLEERMVKIGYAEVVLLLKRSLISKTPLTDVFLQIVGQTIPLVLQGPVTRCPQPAQKTAAKKITLKLFLKDRKFQYAQASHQFVDLLLSFLTFPLGSIGKHLGVQSPVGCLCNLYVSAMNLSSAGCLKEVPKHLLLNPQLPPSFSCSSQLIKIDETGQLNYYRTKESCSCLSSSSWRNYGSWVKCSCRSSTTMDFQVCLTNPKNSSGYLRSSTMYMVTDDLVVTPFSIMSGLSLYKQGTGKVEEIEMEIGVPEALKLLRASLTSKTALTDVFLS